MVIKLEVKERQKIHNNEATDLIVVSLSVVSYHVTISVLYLDRITLGLQQINITLVNTLLDTY